MYDLRDIYTLENKKYKDKDKELQDALNREKELQRGIDSLRDLCNSNKKENNEIKNKIKELENQKLNERDSSNEQSKLLKDGNNLYNIKSKENEKLRNKIQELEKSKKSARESKEINELKNKIQELENLEAQESIIPKPYLLKLNKINLKTLDVKSPLPTETKYKEIKFDKDDEKQNKQTINPATAGFFTKT